jgi:hypothetical protein
MLSPIAEDLDWNGRRFWGGLFSLQGVIWEGRISFN